MLCGVGGRTIAEAQQRMSYDEFQSWVRYRNKRGSFNQGLRTERGAALLAALYANTHSKQSHSISDFAPHLDVPEASIEEAIAAWG